MRKLHLVGLTTDQKGLIFTARRGSEAGGYVVALDAEVLNAIARAQGRANGPSDGPRVIRPGGEYTPGPGAQNRRRGLLTPREIQARLRAGRSVDDVAEEADVEVEWVERFAVPILAEQAQVVELARTLVYGKPRVGASSLPLDESVAWNLLDRGARVPDDLFAVSWSAYQLHDQVWMIRFSYRSRGRAQEARWELDVGSGDLVSRNKVAAELAYVEAGAKLRRPLPVELEEEAEGAAQPAPTRAGRTASRSARSSSVPADLDEGDEDLAADLDDDDDADAEDDEEAATAEAGASDDEDAADSASVEPAAPVGTAADGSGGSEKKAAVETAAEGPAAAGSRKAGSKKAGAAPATDSAGGEPGAGDEPAEGRAKPKPRAKASAAKPKKSTAKAKAAAPAAPFRGPLLVSTRITKPLATRGLLVSSPRMRGATGTSPTTTTTPPAPAPAPTPAAETSPPAGPPGPGAGPAPKPAADDAATTPSATGEAAEVADAPPVDPRQSRSDAVEPTSTPGGAGVRKAVAQVTSVRVAASRALVARAMLPKPAPPVVSRPTLGGRVNQPAATENPPVPLRPRPRDQFEATSSEAPRPPLRLQPSAPEPNSPPASPFRRSSQAEELAGGVDHTAEHPRSPFVPRPAPTSRAERPTAAGTSIRPPVRPAPRPEQTRRPEPARPDDRDERGPGDQQEPGRSDERGAAARRPEARRPEARRPDPGRPEARRLPPGRPDERDAGARRPQPGARRPTDPPPGDSRPNDRRLDDRRRDDGPPDGWSGDGDGADERPGRPPPGAEGRPRIAAQPAGDWRPSGGRQKPPPSGPPVVPPPTGINESRSRRRRRRPPR